MNTLIHSLKVMRQWNWPRKQKKLNELLERVPIDWHSKSSKFINNLWDEACIFHSIEVIDWMIDKGLPTKFIHHHYPIVLKSPYFSDIVQRPIDWKITDDQKNNADFWIEILIKPNAVEIAQWMIQQGFNVNASKHAIGIQWSPLLFVSQNENLELAKLLLDNGADPYQQVDWPAINVKEKVINWLGVDHPIIKTIEAKQAEKDQQILQKSTAFSHSKKTWRRV